MPRSQSALQVEKCVLFDSSALFSSEELSEKIPENGKCRLNKLTIYGAIANMWMLGAIVLCLLNYEIVTLYVTHKLQRGYL